jgi:AraC-like DNA-binding protein
VAGQCTRFLELQRCGAVGIIAARFHSASATAFLCGYMDELTDRIRALETLGRVASGDLAERIRDAGCDTARVALLERWLLQASSDNVPSYSAVVEATRLIRASKGLVDIATVARRLTISTRTLERRFRRTVGLTPKGFARIIRFRQVFDALTHVRDWTWADVALRCGYTDQAHLIHDFGQFSGLSPARFLIDGGEMAAHLASAPMSR